MRCPTCGKLLANVQEQLEREKTLEKKTKKIVNTEGSKHKQKEEELIILYKKYEIARYCCRMRIQSYINETSLIK